MAVKKAGGGALKGVPGMKRRGHPVAAKKAVVAAPPGGKKAAPVAPAMPPIAQPQGLGSLVGGAQGRGMGEKAAPQGANPVGLKRGGRPKGMGC